MAGYQLEVILPIAVLLTVVARVLNKYTSNKYTSNKYTSNKYTSNKYTSNEYTSNKYTSNKPPGDSLSLCESVPQTDHIPFPPSLRLSVRMPSCFWHFRQNAASPHQLIKKWNFRSPRVTYDLARLRPSVMLQRRHRRIKANGAFPLANPRRNSPVFPH